jgi:hypothetical protein
MQPEASRFGGSHKCKQNKTNKLPCFIDRFVQCKSLVVYFREQRTDQLVDLWNYNQLQNELETHVGGLPNVAGFLFLFRLQTSMTIPCNITDLGLICKMGVICHYEILSIGISRCINNQMPLWMLGFTTVMSIDMIHWTHTLGVVFFFPPQFCNIKNLAKFSPKKSKISQLTIDKQKLYFFPNFVSKDNKKISK